MASDRTLRFHPLDAARHLHQLGHECLARLVAHHSPAAQEAELRGLVGQLSEFERDRGEVEEALTALELKDY